MNLKTMNQKDRIDQQEWLVLQISLHIEKLLEEKGISRTELARKLGTDKSYVTKLLDGANLTLRSIADVMIALDSSMMIDTMPLGFHSSIRPLAYMDMPSGIICESPNIKFTELIRGTSAWADSICPSTTDQAPPDQTVCA